MAKRTRPAEEPNSPPSLAPKQAIHLLRLQIDKGNRLLANRPITSAAEQGWETVTRDILTKAFGSRSPHIQTVMSIGYRFGLGGGSEPEWEEDRAKDMGERLHVINDLIELLQSEAGISCPSHNGDPFSLDQILSHRDLLALVREDFDAGKYEAAIFSAFRFLEESVRARAKQPPSAIGVTLMSAAFSPKGVLKHPEAKVDAEAEALHHLMRGAIGWYKNPSSHRAVRYSDPQHASQVLALANLLLDLLGQSNT